VRLHDCFCLDGAYVENVLGPFLPRLVPHLYSDTIKHLLVLVLQSYENIHPSNGRNDAMQVIVPVLTEVCASVMSTESVGNLSLVENVSQLFLDMLQANQTDRLGAFNRREGGVYLSKYFVRDQSGTIRGFEASNHGYHNFLQFMLLEELSKDTNVVAKLFSNAREELKAIQLKRTNQQVAGGKHQLDN
jgi:hypothetical protein